MSSIAIVLLFLSVGVHGGFWGDDFAGVAERDGQQSELLERINEIEKNIDILQAGLPTENRSGRMRRSVQSSSARGSTGPLLTRSCNMCPPGLNGNNGPVGRNGRDGRDGRDGISGTREELCQVENSDKKAEESHHGAYNEMDLIDPVAWRNNKTGAAYIRWGRTNCTESSKLVYKGSAGGSQYNVKGGASNYVCMPSQPIYDQTKAGAGGLRSYLYGAEYETSDFPPFAAVNQFDVPCALCLASGTKTKIMIPASNVCPDGWNTEYTGYLFSERTNDGHRRSEFVCVDDEPEVIPRSSHSTNGILFHVAEGRCASSGSGLPCDLDSGGYIDGFELTCAVCTL